MQSLRSQLIIFFLILIFLPIGLTLWSFADAFEKNTERFVDQATLNILTQSTEQIASLIRSAEQVVEYQNDVFKKRAVGFSRESEQPAIRELLKANIVNLGVLRNIGIVNTSDKHFFMGFMSDEQGLVTKEVRITPDGPVERFWTEKKADESKDGVTEDIASDWQASRYVVAERPWYKAALEQDGQEDFEMIWTSPYVFEQSKDVGITCAKAINEPGQGYRPPFAVTFADISLNGISRVLKELELGDGSHLMLVDKDNHVLASSMPGQQSFQSANSALPTVTDIGDEFLNPAIWQSLQATTAKDQSSALHSYDHKNTGYYARALELEAGNLAGFNWTLWVFVPKDSLLGDYYRSRLHVYYLTSIAAVCALLLAFFIWSRIGTQLGTVISAFGRVQEGDFKTPLAITRAYSEINQLVSHFNGMLKALRENTLMQRLISKTAHQSITSNSDLHDHGELLGESERTYKTLLFSDIRGFTAYSEKKEPEEVVSMLNDYLGLHAEVIEKFDGDIDKYVGDEVFATFDGEDAEYRAVQAASEICRRIRDKGESDKLNVGIGIHCGQVVSGYIGSEGRAQYTSIGSTVNYSARLCSKAGPGEIWVSEAIYDKCGERSDMSVHGDVEFKGFSTAQKVYQVNY